MNDYDIQPLVTHIEYDIDLNEDERSVLREIILELVSNNRRLQFIIDKYTTQHHSNVDDLDYYIIGGNMGAGNDPYNAIDNMIVERQKRREKCVH